jgi:hypothetical protein
VSFLTDTRLVQCGPSQETGAPSIPHVLFQLALARRTEEALRRTLGQLSRARQDLCEALHVLAENPTLEPYLYLLPAVALLLAEQRSAERAIKLYSLASRYPSLSKSRWFQDVMGRQITAVGATLPPDRRAAMEARGRTQDLDATAIWLLAELGG